jgi:hypothetical protein
MRSRPAGGHAMLTYELHREGHPEDASLVARFQTSADHVAIKLAEDLMPTGDVGELWRDKLFIARIAGPSALGPLETRAISDTSP